MKNKISEVVARVSTGLLLAIVLMSAASCSESKSEDARMRDEYGCHRDDPNYNACREKGIYLSDMCFNSSVLVATTTGSPNGYSCNNKHHKMRVEPVTKAGEEIGALVFCECVK
jgi:hypothetical protein